MRPSHQTLFTNGYWWSTGISQMAFKLQTGHQRFKGREKFFYFHELLVVKVILKNNTSKNMDI